MIIAIRKGNAIADMATVRDLNACGIWPSPAGESNPHYPPSMLNWVVEHPETWQIVVSDDGPITPRVVSLLAEHGWKRASVWAEGGSKRLPSGVTEYTVRIEEWARA